MTRSQESANAFSFPSRAWERDKRWTTLPDDAAVNRRRCAKCELRLIASHDTQRRAGEMQRNESLRPPADPTEQPFRPTRVRRRRWHRRQQRVDGVAQFGRARMPPSRIALKQSL